MCAGMGIGMLEGVGIRVLQGVGMVQECGDSSDGKEVCFKFLGFLESWFLHFLVSSLVSWFQSFRASEFQRFGKLFNVFGKILSI